MHALTFNDFARSDLYIVIKGRTQFALAGAAAPPYHILNSEGIGGSFKMHNALQSAPSRNRRLNTAAITDRSSQRRCTQLSRRPPSNGNKYVSSSSSRLDDQRLCQITCSNRRVRAASAGSAAISWSDDEPGMAPVQPVAEVGGKTEGASFLQVPFSWQT